MISVCPCKGFCIRRFFRKYKACSFRLINAPVDIQCFVFRLFFCVISAIQLIFLQTQRQIRFLIFIANIGFFFIPAIKSIIFSRIRLIEFIAVQIFCCNGIRMNHFTINMIVHREFIPYHHDDIGPAIDCDFIQSFDCFTIFILIPCTIVEPAIKYIAICEFIRGIIVLQCYRFSIQGNGLLLTI